MEMNSKVVPSLGHCFANLFLHGITKQPVHCIISARFIRLSGFFVVCTIDIKAAWCAENGTFEGRCGTPYPGLLYPGNLH